MELIDVLKNLQFKKNVILMGAPGTGKSRMMNEVAAKFENGLDGNDTPQVFPGQSIPIPENDGYEVLSFLQKNNRKVFRTALHQNSKYRDFLTGITPRFDGSDGYQISEGILYRANEFAKQPDSAALLIIDELNRGPAIDVFGPSIVTIEPDKRLGDDNNPTKNTQFFELLSPSDKKYVQYSFSPHLYILAAMNQADVSVAPLDVAFMRRWMTMMLLPDYTPLYEKFGINDEAAQIPNSPLTVQDVYHAAINALKLINEKIKIGRGKEYQLGQGVFLSTCPNGNTIDDALEFVKDVWLMIYAHVEELFFGDPNSLAYMLDASSSNPIYSLEQVTFANENKIELKANEITKDNIYSLFLYLND